MEKHNLYQNTLAENTTCPQETHMGLALVAAKVIQYLNESPP